MVRGSARAASRLGISPIVVGLTVVSIGTSMPELAVGVVAAVEGSGALAVGNIAGSIYNILLILGVTCLVPAHGLELTPALVRIDIPIMVAVALACIPIFITGRRVGRIEGGAMVVGYLAYLAFLLATQT
jgi:cation:H+ antiporter